MSRGALPNAASSRKSAYGGAPILATAAGEATGTSMWQRRSYGWRARLASVHAFRRTFEDQQRNLTETTPTPGVPPARTGSASPEAWRRQAARQLASEDRGWTAEAEPVACGKVAALPLSQGETTWI